MLNKKTALFYAILLRLTGCMNLAPMLGTNAGYTRSQAQGRTGDRYQVGLGVSNFKLDFFGRIKNQSEAALNRYLQTQEARDAAQSREKP